MGAIVRRPRGQQPIHVRVEETEEGRVESAGTGATFDGEAEKERRDGVGTRPEKDHVEERDEPCDLDFDLASARIGAGGAWAPAQGGETAAWLPNGGVLEYTSH